MLDRCKGPQKPREPECQLPPAGSGGCTEQVMSGGRVGQGLGRTKSWAWQNKNRNSERVGRFKIRGNRSARKTIRSSTGGCVPELRGPIGKESLRSSEYRCDQVRGVT